MDDRRRRKPGHKAHSAGAIAMVEPKPDYWLTIPCVLCDELMYGGMSTGDGEWRVYNCNGCGHRLSFDHKECYLCAECGSYFVGVVDFICPPCRQNNRREGEMSAT